MAATPKVLVNPKKRKVKIKVGQKAELRKKNTHGAGKMAVGKYSDAPTRPPADVAPTFRIKIRRKR